MLFNQQGPKMRSLIIIGKSIYRYKCYLYHARSIMREEMNNIAVNWVLAM